MEAMFDRMDAIGKSILGLTIQCAQCHSHKYDPLTQEEYYRMFAFLNNTHEANIAVYTPEEQMKRAEIFRKIREIEARLQHEHPDWPERMHAWEDSRANRAACPGRSFAPRSAPTTTAAQKHDLLEDGSILAEGYAPTMHTTQFTALKPVRNVAAVRLELLNDPSLPLQGPGRSSKGLCALTEMRLEAAPADKPDQQLGGEIRPGHGRCESARTRAGADLRRQDRPAAGHRARSASPSTARTKRPGASTPAPAGATCRARPFSCSRSRSRFRRAILTFKLTQNHGGWNSDDNQNNNLGRFRLLRDRSAERRRPTWFRGRSARSLPSRASSEPPPRMNAVFSYWRTTVPEWKRPTTGSRRSGSSTRRDRRSSCSRIASSPGQTHLLERGDFLKPGKVVSRGTPAFLQSAARRPAGHPPDLRPMAGGSAVADDGPRDRQPGLAELISARASSAPAKTSARSARRRRIRSCSTGWPSSSWIAAGA